METKKHFNKQQLSMDKSSYSAYISSKCWQINEVLMFIWCPCPAEGRGIFVSDEIVPVALKTLYIDEPPASVSRWIINPLCKPMEQ